jgi:hypothetical protein
MKCLACGAELRLMDIRTDTTTPFGIERRVYQCLSCRQIAQRLRLNRPRVEDTPYLPTVPMASEAPNIKPQMLRNGALAASANAIEKVNKAGLNQQTRVDWGRTVETFSRALKKQASAARASSWARTMEKLRNRQMALKERAATVDVCDTTREGRHRDHHQGLMGTGASQQA